MRSIISTKTLLKFNNQKSLKTTVTYDKKIARSYHKLGYYNYEEDRLKYLYPTFLEKLKLSTPHSEIVNNVIDKWINIGETEENKIFKVLTNIRDKNIQLIKNKITPPKHSQLINIIANPFILIAAYRTIRPKKGALTKAAFLPAFMYNALDIEQKEIIKKSYILPDGMNWEIINAISNHIKKGTYPWGASRRIWIPKPGVKDKQRPITIPPFGDKIVQEAIRMVLESIYEPTFMSMNVSFGFRASNGCHENIISIKDNSQGFTTAIEGDIEDAYPKVDNSILLEILSKSINDQKFLKLMKERLTLTLFDTKDKSYLTSFLGIPQGGIDSPYLFNIYLLGMDQFIINKVKEILDNINIQRLQNTKRPVNKIYVHHKNAMDARIKKYKLHKKYYKAILSSEAPQQGIVLKGRTYTLEIEKQKMFEALKEKKKIRNKMLHTPYKDPKTNKLRFVYSRYADDFIILGNFDNQIAQNIKDEIKNWLSVNRNAKLSEQKTFITNLLRSPAKFLGFEIKATKNRKYTYVQNQNNKIFLQRTFGWGLYIGPDRQRMINRLYIKGYCDRKGQPVHIPWLSSLEPHIIIKKFNEVMTGFAQYYTSFISNKALLSRWLYIIRFSALKTLAQKYNSKISKIIKKFNDGESNQLSAVYFCNAKDKNGKIIQLKKKWTLLTQAQVIQNANNKRNIQISKKLRSIAKGEFIFTETEGKLRTPRIFDADFLDRINWVNYRTLATFDMPCCKCGSIENIEMHHIKAIRKQKYSLIPKVDTIQRLLSLRNRKQVPLCQICHNKVHSNKNNTKIDLKSTVIPALDKKLFDNRIIDSERFIHKGKVYQSLPFVENLLDKGWKIT